MKIAPTSVAISPQADQAATRPALKPARGVEKAARVKEARQASEAQQAEQNQKTESPSEATEQALERLQDQAGQALSPFGHSVRIQADDSGRVIMQVVDKDSGELVRQFPNEDTLVLAERLDEMRGILFSAEG
jgi:flagellar protein FlaG